MSLDVANYVTNAVFRRDDHHHVYVVRHYFKLGDLYVWIPICTDTFNRVLKVFLQIFYQQIVSVFWYPDYVIHQSVANMGLDSCFHDNILTFFREQDSGELHLRVLRATLATPVGLSKDY